MYTQLEQNARRAKNAMSFSDYTPGSATAEYNEYCAQAEEIAQDAKERLIKQNAPTDRLERVDYLLQLYKTKKMNWLNELYSNRAKVPSIMISGGSNFPVRAKERQNNKESKLWDENPDYILQKIEGIAHNAKTIYSDEANAVDRIKAKIKTLETMPDPYGNKKAEIRRLRGRLLELAPGEFKEEQENITINGAKTYEDIIALWDSGKVSRSQYDAENRSLYFELPLDFYNSKRHYKEFLSFEIDETQQNLIRFDARIMETVLIPLTDKQKYFLIINKISGSGNKAVIYNHLKSLAPQKEEEQAPQETTVTINQESAEIVRNREISRLQLLFDGKPSEETRIKLKGAGFKWAPSSKAWQRLLNANAEYALTRIIDK